MGMFTGLVQENNMTGDHRILLMLLREFKLDNAAGLEDKSIDNKLHM
jgi:hypothetical protein